jgi:hypothetical protein
MASQAISTADRGMNEFLSEGFLFFLMADIAQFILRNIKKI